MYWSGQESRNLGSVYIAEHNYQLQTRTHQHQLQTCTKYQIIQTLNSCLNKTFCYSPDDAIYPERENTRHSLAILKKKISFKTNVFFLKSHNFSSYWFAQSRTEGSMGTSAWLVQGSSTKCSNWYTAKSPWFPSPFGEDRDHKNALQERKHLKTCLTKSTLHKTKLPEKKGTKTHEDPNFLITQDLFLVPIPVRLQLLVCNYDPGNSKALALTQVGSKGFVAWFKHILTIHPAESGSQMKRGRYVQFPDGCIHFNYQRLYEAVQLRIYDQNSENKFPIRLQLW